MSWPRPLQPASGPFPEFKVEGARQGMGEWGAATSRLAEAGIVQPDMLTGLTLFILSSQPRDPNQRQEIKGGGGGVAGGVWVRERFAIYQPMRRGETFAVTGASLGRHVHKGRRYGTTSSETRTAAGELLAANLTTGLLAYRVQEGLEDALEGADPDSLPAPAMGSPEIAAANPHLEALRSAQAGEELVGTAVTVGLELMAARDTSKPDNPIHSDPEAARKAGLARPIAGGSHVLAFALELIMGRFGHEALLHGATFDVRWKAPVEADAVIHPRVVVAEVNASRVALDAEVKLASGATAMVARIEVPLAS